MEKDANSFKGPTASFTMHVIAMLMKQHSYTSYNIELATKNQRLKSLTEASKKKNSADLNLEEMVQLEKELIKETVKFPENITFVNFTDYLLVPTLVYELEYPRTSRFRFWYFCERVYSLFICIFAVYFVIEHWVI